MSNKLTDTERRRIITYKCKDLEDYEYNYIFELLKDENKQYTHNNNGVYINLEKISMKTIEEIENYLETVQKRKDYKKINEKLLSENAPAPLELKTENLYDVFTYTQEYDPMYKLMNENQKMIIKETINKKK
tara:strand:+ start:149 stop:544 length:396 start_codon:yes stop_codon:yes gene_type:complete